MCKNIANLFPGYHFCLNTSRVFVVSLQRVFGHFRSLWSIKTKTSFLLVYCKGRIFLKLFNHHSINCLKNGIEYSFQFCFGG